MIRFGVTVVFTVEAVDINDATSAADQIVGDINNYLSVTDAAVDSISDPRDYVHFPLLDCAPSSESKESRP